jgi:hypothetical protein
LVLLSTSFLVEGVMGDVVFVAVIVAFFALTVTYVRACERLVGRDTAAEAVLGADTDRGYDGAGRRLESTPTFGRER